MYRQRRTVFVSSHGFARSTCSTRRSPQARTRAIGFSPYPYRLVAFAIAGVIAFRRSRTTVNPLHPEQATALVTRGVYRLSRNPMYAGMLLLLLAWATRLSNTAALAGPLLFALYITRFQIIPEERALTALFGEKYAAYRAKVRRWF